MSKGNVIEPACLRADTHRQAPGGWPGGGGAQRLFAGAGATRRAWVR